MSNRSDDHTETTERSAQSTDELLAETERLLSESNGGGGRATVGSQQPANDPATREAEPASRSSRLPSVPSRLSIRRYISLQAFLVLVLALGASMLAGGIALPIAGRVIGMFTVAFVVGVLSSKRRYLEMTAAGISVGALAALANYAVLAVAGSGRAVVAVGASAGFVSCVGGYYFGRDLRNGLRRDVE